MQSEPHGAPLRIDALRWPGYPSRTMKQILLALVLIIGPSAVASAQPLDRRPVSSLTLLKARAKRTVSESPALIPAIASVIEEETLAFNSASSKIFATRIHPILMNACMSCHGKNDYAGAFKLKRLEEGYENAAGVEQNLRATVKQLDRVNSGSSLLLVKSLEAHGKMKVAPFGSKAHPAYKNLELWSYWATLRDGTPLPDSVPQMVVKRPEPTLVPANPIQLTAATIPAVEPAKLPENFAVQPKVNQPSKLNPNDPFDPASFNRAAYPLRK